MAHGITATDGMAYAGRVPWHGLGVKVEGGAMTAAQAIDAAGMNWLVEAEPIYRYVGGTYLPIDGKAATVRKDTGAVLGMVSNKYTPVQNIECFAFFDEVVGAGDAVYHTVGSLWGGRRVWILAHMGNGPWVLDNGEQLESYVLLDNSHDGGSALRMRLTPVEVVCANTLAAATVRDAAFYARHTSGIKTRVKAARDLLGLNQLYMDRFMAECNDIADKALTSFEMEALTRKLLYLDPGKDLADQHGVRGAGGLKMMELFRHGVGRRGESRWDAFGAVTEFADFWKGSRSIGSLGSGADDVVNRRLSENWFGEGQRMRTQAWDILRMPSEAMRKALQPTITQPRN